MRMPDTSNPLVIVAIGLAIAAMLWGVAQLIPPIFDGVGTLITAFGAAGGLAVAAATTGFATAGSTSTWLAPAAAAGVAAIGVGMTYIVLHRIVEEAKERPYDWLLPALGLLAVFCVDLSKDELLATGTERALYALITGCCTIGGGILLLNKRLAVRALGFVVPFFPTLFVWGALVREGQVTKGISDFVRAGSVGALGLTGVLILGFVIVVLGVLLPNRQEPS